MAAHVTVKSISFKLGLCLSVSLAAFAASGTARADSGYQPYYYQDRDTLQFAGTQPPQMQDQQVVVTQPAMTVAPGPIISGHNWTGIYLGGDLGAGLGDAHKEFSNGSGTGTFSTQGLIGGGTVGYNYQWEGWVTGLEGDLSGTEVGGSHLCPDGVHNCSISNNWLSTARIRAGYTFGNIMPFVTGGVAAGDMHVKNTVQATGYDDVDYTETKFGGAVGGGVEMALMNNWSIKGEYLYVKMDNTHAPNSDGTSTDNKFSENILRVGLNYNFR